MLVTVEGIDGSGKSATCDALASAFPDAVLTREPTDSWYGAAVERSIESEDADALAELFLYTADHADHLGRVIQPALANDALVISDRFADSRYAYQGVSLADRFPDAMEFVREIHEPWTETPDLTLYLDVPAAVGVERSGAITKFERTEFLSAVREHYERLIAADPDRFVRIDATQPQAVVADEAVAAIREANE